MPYIDLIRCFKP